MLLESITFPCLLAGRRASPSKSLLNWWTQFNNSASSVTSAVLSRWVTLMQVYKVYLKYLAGLLPWWTPPEGTVFNIPLFTGWEEALAKQIPMSWWKRLQFQAMIRFNKWLYPRPKLFKWLNVSSLASVYSKSDRMITLCSNTAAGPVFGHFGLPLAVILQRSEDPQHPECQGFRFNVLCGEEPAGIHWASFRVICIKARSHAAVHKHRMSGVGPGTSSLFWA